MLTVWRSGTGRYTLTADQHSSLEKRGVQAHRATRAVELASLDDAAALRDDPRMADRSAAAVPRSVSSIRAVIVASPNVVPKYPSLLLAHAVVDGLEASSCDDTQDGSKRTPDGTFADTKCEVGREEGHRSEHCDQIRSRATIESQYPGR
jgi:hypothetical protein